MTTDKEFFGHPRGLSTLFFTEMWERFSYYGMRAMLLLFMVTSVDKGGLGFDDKTGGAIYGIYTMFVYLLALPGGWLADKYFGLRKAVFYGGCLISLGHICLVFNSVETFFFGLALIVIGTGLLKPSISSLVGQLYPDSEPIKRDAGFSIFYMGINLGGFIAPIITGLLRVHFNWHYGFAIAGIAMIAGLIQYKLTENRLGKIGLPPSTDTGYDDPNAKKIKVGLIIFLLVLVLLFVLLFTQTISINPILFAQSSAYILGGSVVLYLFYLFVFERLDATEKKKIAVIGILFIFSSIFWAGYEQQGSSLNLFGDRYTNRFVFNWEMPAEVLQSVDPVFVVIFSPVFAFLWIWLARHKVNPSTPVKVAMGLLFMAMGFLVMVGASYLVVKGEKPLSTWLIFTYLFHTFGEICLYPVGLSAVTKLSPKKLSGQLMGIWFMSIAFGNLIAGLYAGQFDEHLIMANPKLLTDLFWVVVSITGISGLIMLIISKQIRSLMGDVK